MAIFFALAFAQILSDFPWQTDRMLERKRNAARGPAGKKLTAWAGFVGHGLILLCASAVFVSPWWSIKLILAVVIITFVHILLDYLRCRYLSTAAVSIVLLDQFVHLASMIAVLTVMGVSLNDTISDRLMAAWRSHKGPASVLVFGYVLSIWVGTILVRSFLDTIGRSDTIDEGLRTAGKRIGQLERFLVTTLTILDQYGAIAFVFAAKSIARFKKMEDEPMFAEYYLAGTLASVSVAMLAGLLIKGGLALLGVSK